MLPYTEVVAELATLQQNCNRTLTKHYHCCSHVNTVYMVLTSVYLQLHAAFTVKHMMTVQQDLNTVPTLPF